MDYAKAIDSLIDMEMQEIIPKNGEEVLRFARGIIEQADKYRWHDLWKNPQDLPTEHKVLACIQGISKPYYETIYYGKPYGVYPKPKGKVFFDSFSEYGDYVLDNVIGWAYIPPFESEDE